MLQLHCGTARGWGGRLGCRQLQHLVVGAGGERKSQQAGALHQRLLVRRRRLHRCAHVHQMGPWLQMQQVLHENLMPESRSGPGSLNVHVSDDLTH